jgi:hypothetical protein
VLEAVYTAPFGSGPGAALLHVRMVELVAHGWDLARVTGQRAAYPDDLVEQTLAVTRQRLTSRPEGPGRPVRRRSRGPAWRPCHGSPGRLRRSASLTQGASRAADAAYEDLRQPPPSEDGTRRFCAWKTAAKSG